ncbi:hypothetical protein DL767_003036 [Monosporascus sp. MG133]|nr:hypothetical protein DL767_003036 [Monosporascus sp. MG133]
MPTLPTVSMRRAVHDTIRGLVTRAEFGRNDFDFDFPATQNTVRTGQRLSGGLIAGIISIVFVSFCIFGCVVYSLVRKWRHDRRQMEVKNDTRDSGTSCPKCQNCNAPYPMYPNSGPGVNDPVADPPPVYTPCHTSGTYKGPDGDAAGDHSIGHSSGHAGGHGAGHCSGSSGGHGFGGCGGLSGGM